MNDSIEADLARARITRRQALGGIGGGLVAAALPPGGAEAAPFEKPNSREETVSPIGRRGCTVTSLPTGMVLVAGGIQSNTTGMAQIYDPLRREWFDAAPMHTPRAHHAAAVLFDGRILVAGGRFINVLASAEIYDPRRDQWTLVAPMNGPRAEHGAASIHPPGVLVTGGVFRTPLSTAELYDPFRDRWLIL